MLSIDGFEALVSAADSALLGRTPILISYKSSDEIDSSAAENDSVLRHELRHGANIYAIWCRCGENAPWRVMYIGQRTRNSVLERIKQHLFKTPNGTQSKLEQVHLTVKSGAQIGVSTVLISPDTVRLSVEDQLIFRNTNHETDLPWNNKSRNISLPRT